MSISMVMCKPAGPSVHAPAPPHLNRDLLIPRRPKEKVVVILGATGTGKSRLAIDIASHFPSEIINSDKIQMHQGLDIATNKVTEEEMCGIPHHLLGTIDPNADFTAMNFSDTASRVIDLVSGRGKLPIVAGGSNSYIEALVTGRGNRVGSRYDFCFLWVDVAARVLNKFVSDRVDKMVENGMIEEVRKFYKPNGDYSRGVRRAIGVPELDRYFRTERFLDGGARARLLEEAIKEIKNNNCKLAAKQVERIRRFRDIHGWNIHRIDATQVFLRSGADDAKGVWDGLVAGPSTMIVAEFLYNVGRDPWDDAMTMPTIQPFITY